MKRETQVVVVKAIATLVVGVAVAAVATAVIKHNVPLDGLTKVNKVIYGIGAFVISSMAAEAGMNYTETFVDGLFSAIKPLEDLKNQPIQTEEPQ